MSNLTVEKYHLLESIAKSENFINYNIDVKSGSMKGDGYMGIINIIKINENNKNELNLVLKSAIDSINLRAQAPIEKAYQREIFMYDTIFKEYINLQNEYNVDYKFNEFPQFYGSLMIKGNECLLLEDLRHKGYQLWNRKVPMDRNHAEIVFETYGKFHGMSFALQHLKSDLFDNYKGKLVNIFENSDKYHDSFTSMFETLKKGLKADERMINGLNTFQDELMNFFESLRDPQQQQQQQQQQKQHHTVITHGDCWCNNMMFYYEDYPIPSKMCLLDWQISRIAFPVMDLSYFLYACCSIDIIRNYDQLLNIYYQSLKKLLKEFNLNVDIIFPFEELHNQWKIYSKYGLIMAMLVLKVMLSDTSEVPDFAELADSGMNIVDALTTGNPATNNKDEYYKRIQDLLLFMLDNNFL